MDLSNVHQLLTKVTPKPPLLDTKKQHFEEAEDTERARHELQFLSLAIGEIEKDLTQDGIY